MNPIIITLGLALASSASASASQPRQFSHDRPIELICEVAAGAGPLARHNEDGTWESLPVEAVLELLPEWQARQVELDRRGRFYLTVEARTAQLRQDQRLRGFERHSYAAERFPDRIEVWFDRPDLDVEAARISRMDGSFTWTRRFRIEPYGLYPLPFEVRYEGDCQRVGRHDREF